MFLSPPHTHLHDRHAQIIVMDWLSCGFCAWAGQIVVAVLVLVTILSYVGEWSALELWSRADNTISSILPGQLCLLRAESEGQC